MMPYLSAMPNERLAALSSSVQQFQHRDSGAQWGRGGDGWTRHRNDLPGRGGGGGAGGGAWGLLVRAGAWVGRLGLDGCGEYGQAGE